MELCHIDKIISTQERVYFVNTNEGKKKEFSKIYMIYLSKSITRSIAFIKKLFYPTLSTINF